MTTTGRCHRAMDHCRSISARKYRGIDHQSRGAEHLRGSENTIAEIMIAEIMVTIAEIKVKIAEMVMIAGMGGRWAARTKSQHYSR